jgi:GTP-binding protein Era
MEKVAVVGVVGRTNAGKSTLVNALVGEKVSIVSPVEQTTRNTVRGIVSDPRGQLVLLDTPGLHKAVGTLGTLLNRMARRSAAGTDVTCVVFDAAQEPQLEDIGWMQRIAKEKPEKVVFVLNKADKSPFFETMFRDAWKEAIESAASAEADHSDTDGSVSCSPVWVKSISTTEGGAKSVLDALFDFAEEGEKLFDDDIVTDYPRKLAIADVVREKMLQRLRDEVPHEVGVAVKDIYEDPRRGWDVAVTIYVNRPSQKGIVIGPRGSLLKAVRLSAEPEIADMFGVRVRLELWVKVEPNWMKNGRLLAEMGYLGAER